MYTPNVHNPENCNLWIDDSTVPSKKNDMALLNRQYMNPLLQRVRGGVFRFEAAHKKSCGQHLRSFEFCRARLEGCNIC